MDTPTSEKHSNAENSAMLGSGKWKVVQQTYGTLAKDDSFANAVTLRRDLRQRRSLEDDLPTPWFVDPHVWWRHPFARMMNAWLILLLDFWIYFEDPINESHVKFTQEGFGQVFGFCLSWNDDGQHSLRFVLLIASLISALYIGNEWVHHRFLRDWMGLSAFTENKGAFFVKLACLPFTLYIGSHIYNLSVSGNLRGPIDDQTHVPFHSMAAFFQYGSVFLDVLTLIQVTDVVLQDRDVYGDWAASIKVIWNDACGGWVRIIMVWVCGPALLGALYFAIYAFGYGSISLQWDSGFLANGCGGLNACQRTLVASVIIFCDLLQVSQDWEFPTFDKAEDTMVVGTFEQEVSCNCLANFLQMITGMLGFLPEWVYDLFSVHMDGAWMIYGPLFCSLCADLFCAKNQFTYVPANYGQYKDGTLDRVWNIKDVTFLDSIFNARGDLVHPEFVTFAERHDPTSDSFNATSVATDHLLNTHVLDFGYKWLAATPGIFAILAFICLVYGGEHYWQQPVTLAAVKQYASSSLQSWLRKSDKSAPSLESSSSSPLAVKDHEKEKEPKKRRQVEDKPHEMP